MRTPLFRFIVGLSAAKVLLVSAEEPSDPTRLEGVPTRIEAQILDVTHVPAERDLFVATDVPSPERYLHLLPKERPWSFTGVRPQQRRVVPTASPPSSPTIRVEVLPLLPGQIRYSALFAKGVRNVHAAFSLDGDSQNNRFTRGRGAQTTTQFRGTFRAPAGENSFLGLLEWQNRSSNWKNAQKQLVAKDERFRRLLVGGEHQSADFSKIAWTWDFDAREYQLEETLSRPDVVREIAAHGTATLSRELAPQTLDLWLEYTRRETPRTQAFSAAAVTLLFEDRYVPLGWGVVDYQGGIRLYGDPKEGSRRYPAPESQRAVRWALPFRLGVTSVQLPWTFRSTVGFSVRRFPLSEYMEHEWTLPNPFLPSERAWSITTSVERAWKKKRVGVEASYRYVRGLPVWLELETEEKSTLVWMPVEARAHLLEERLYVEIPLSKNGRLKGNLRTEHNAGKPDNESDFNSPLLPSRLWERLPYRPRVRAEADYTWRASEWKVEASARWIGRRYRDPVSKATLAPYGLLGMRISRDLSHTIRLFLGGELVLGERRTFTSRHSWEPYRVAQNLFGVGIQGQL